MVKPGASAHHTYSLDYPHGRILDSGAMIRDCTSCGWAGGRFVFAVKADVLEYRSMFMQIRGHGFTDREHPGSASLVNPATGLFELTNANCDYDQPGVTCGIPFTSRYVSSTGRVVAWVWMTQAWGDAYDLYYLRLTYQYAVWL